MSRRTPTLIVLACVILAALPWLVLTYINHGSLSVPPEIMNDSAYYYARMETVASGHPFIGNPYFKEHTDAMASAFFGADWVASLPLLAHIPLVATALINLAISAAVFVLLALWLVRRLGFGNRWQTFGVLALFATAYWLLLRPVAMQVVFPSFLFFLVSYLAWLQNPNSKKNVALLALSSALTFYLYTYLWQIVAIVIGLTHLLFLTSARRRYLSLIAADAAIALLAAPIIWYTYLQLQNPDYWQTVTRIGYIATHTFGSAAIVNLGLVFAVFIILSLVRVSRMEKAAVLFFLITGLALIVATFSNVITGKDLETAVHIERFVELWAVLALAYAVALYGEHASTAKAWLPVVLSVVLLLDVLSNQLIIYRNSDVYLAGERYKDVLAWLNNHTQAGDVVFADDSLSYYIPAVTHNFVLFQPDGGLYLMPDREVEDRYLASRVFMHLTEDQLKADFRKYAGVGNAVHAYKIHNRETALCHILHLGMCEETITDGVALRGAAYFDELYSRYQSMEANPESVLASYGARYVLIPETATLPYPLAATVAGYRIYRMP